MGGYRQPPTVSGDSYTTLIDWGFASVAADDWSGNMAGADVAETIDGVSVTTNRHTSATSFGPDGSTGLIINGTGGSSFVIGSAALGSYTPTLHRLLIQMTLTATGITTSVGALQVQLREDADELFSCQIRQASGYGVRYNSIYNTSTTTRSQVVLQAGAFSAARVEMDVLDSYALIRADMDAGSALPAPGTMTLRDRGSRTDRAVAASLASPGVRVSMNPGGAVVTIKHLRVLRYAL